MKYRSTKLSDDDFSTLKADFEAVLDMLVEDIREALGKGTLLTVGFKATEEFIEYFKTQKNDGSYEAFNTKKLYNCVAECKGMIGLKSGVVRIPLNVLYAKIAAVERATVISTFETVYEILKACLIPAIEGLNILYLKTRDEGINVKGLFQTADKWSTGLFTLEKELEEYKHEQTITPGSLPYYPGFTYARAGEDVIKNESKEPADHLVIEISDQLEIKSPR